jgi:catechol 2,3-dioxygenase-like lactoylglutathione lyase family enzyme
MRLSHHAITVKDMDRAIDIYCGQMGLRLLRRKPGVAYAEVAMLEDASGHRIELLLQEGSESSGLDHIAFEVDDVDEAFERLTNEGFTAEREPFDVAGGIVRTSFLRTPDGVKLELMRYATAPGPEAAS